MESNSKAETLDEKRERWARERQEFWGDRLAQDSDNKNLQFLITESDQTRLRIYSAINDEQSSHTNDGIIDLNEGEDGVYR